MYTKFYKGINDFKFLACATYFLKLSTFFSYVYSLKENIESISDHRIILFKIYRVKKKKICCIL